MNPKNYFATSTPCLFRNSSGLSFLLAPKNPSLVEATMCPRVIKRWSNIPTNCKIYVSNLMILLQSKPTITLNVTTWMIMIKMKVITKKNPSGSSFEYSLLTKTLLKSCAEK